MSLAGASALVPSQVGESKPATSSLAAPFEPIPADETSRKSQDGETEEKKKKKRSLFGFGKKKTDDSDSAKASGKESITPEEKGIDRKPTSPIQTDSHHTIPHSPNRNALSSSPRLSSPAGSQIFERDVQESSAALMPNSPAIPSHITTEDKIPPVLDASSEAITDGHLSPDAVEIITHNAHQPAAVTVTGVSGSPIDSSSASHWADELASFADRTDVDSASNYGSFDTTDVRRLSFISFADVVQAEQHGPSITNQSSDSIGGIAGLTSLASLGAAGHRSPSPIRSPVSSQPSPPTSKSGSVKGLELSPSRKPLGSPGLGPQHAGELNIETMSQALRRTGSTDLSAVRSMPTSPVEGPAH